MPYFATAINVLLCWSLVAGSEPEPGRTGAVFAFLMHHLR